MTGTPAETGDAFSRRARSFERRQEDPDGTLVLQFSPDPAGGRIDSALVNAPDPL